LLETTSGANLGREMLIPGANDDDDVDDDGGGEEEEEEEALSQRERMG